MDVRLEQRTADCPDVKATSLNATNPHALSGETKDQIGGSAPGFSMLPNFQFLEETCRLWNIGSFSNKTGHLGNFVMGAYLQMLIHKAF
jgi:hypothetical protein